MPKFVSGSSGHVYAHDRSNQEKDPTEDAIPAADDAKAKDHHQKPSAINKKGSREKQKNSLDLFKEELRRLNEQRHNQRNKVKKNLTTSWKKPPSTAHNSAHQPPEPPKLFTLPLQQTNLPFNAQLAECDKDYIVRIPHPRPLPAELEADVETNLNLRDIKEDYDKFAAVVERSTVVVIPPSDRSIVHRIHKTIEYLMREGPVFESIIIARENKNPNYSFLYDNKSQEHVYYRWKLYSLLHGDDPHQWSTEEFRMYEGGPIWRPPPVNAHNEAMSGEVSDWRRKSSYTNRKEGATFYEKAPNLSLLDDSRAKGSLGEAKREMLGDQLRNLDPTKKRIGSLMMFCINHSDAAKEIIDDIYESLRLLETPFQKKIARLFLISDILHNCSAAVTNASFYREGFQVKLIPIFEHLREYLINIEDRYKADKFKQKVLTVLGAWKEWTLYEDEFVIRLSDILLSIKPKDDQEKSAQTTKAVDAVDGVEKKQVEEDLDGTPIDEQTFSRCLELKGLSLRWYETLELSEDEDDCTETKSMDDQSPRATTKEATNAAAAESKIRFKTSKWETVDPNELAEQVVTLSKWETQVGQDEATSGASPASCPSTGNGHEETPEGHNSDSSSQSNKRVKLDEEQQVGD